MTELIFVWDRPARNSRTAGTSQNGCIGHKIDTGTHKFCLLRSRKLASALIDIVTNGSPADFGTNILRAFAFAALGSVVEDSSVRVVLRVGAAGCVDKAAFTSLRVRSFDRLSDV